MPVRILDGGISGFCMDPNFEPWGKRTKKFFNATTSWFQTISSITLVKRTWLSRFLQPSKELNLNFGGCRALTDSSLIILSTQGLQPLLTSLALNFKSCKLITDKGISSFSSLCKLPNLISFSLSLRLTSDISDQSLVNLTSRYPLLANLALDISYCSLITHKSFEFLPSTLNSLKIHLIDCKQFTDSSVISLSTSLLPLINLTSLDISFSICYQLTDQSISHFSSQFLHHLSNLTSLNLLNAKKNPEVWCSDFL